VPALVEAMEIQVDGADLSYLDEVAHVSVRKGFDAASHAHIEIDTTHDRTGIAARFVVGASVSIKISTSTTSTPMEVFVGTVLGIGCELNMGRSQFVVDAYDKSYVLGRSTETATHLRVTYSQIVQKIAQQVGLTSDIQGLPTAEFESVQQFGTPHQFIDRITRSSGCEWFVDGKRLVVRPRTTSGTTVALTGGVDLMSFSARYSASEEASDLTVRGWDPVSQTEVVGTATAPTATATAPVVAANRKKIHPKAAVAWPRTPFDQNDATAIATALHQWMDDSSMTGRGQTYANPAIVPGVMLDIDGMGSQWNGKYRVSEVEHSFRPSTSWVTRFTLGAPEPTSLVDLLGAPSVPTSQQFLGGVTIGVVTNLEDPEGQRRVKLKLPYLSDTQDTGWARVVQLGAGKGRGLWIHPEPGDEVIVAFEQGDARRPIVLGGVWSSKNTSPATAVVDNGALSGRSLTSREGHLLHFDDKEKLIEVKHATSNAHVVLDADKGIVVEAPDGDLEIKNAQGSIKIAKNGDITLTGNKITIKAKQDVSIEGLNVNTKSQVATKVEAGTTLDLKGTAPTTLESSAITTVKGSLVKIN
jgi:uncharacterized protein involved in type VI secretion and phage assembly